MVFYIGKLTTADITEMESFTPGFESTITQPYARANLQRRPERRERSICRAVVKAIFSVGRLLGDLLMENSEDRKFLEAHGLEKA